MQLAERTWELSRTCLPLAMPPAWVNTTLLELGSPPCPIRQGACIPRPPLEEQCWRFKPRRLQSSIPQHVHFQAFNPRLHADLWFCAPFLQ